MTSSNKLPPFLQITSKNHKEWIWPKQRGFNHGCCNCGLVHCFNFRVIKITETLKGRKRETMPLSYQVEFQIKYNGYMTHKVRKKEIKKYYNESR